MSALAGVWYWDGRPVTEAELKILAEYSLVDGPDGGGTALPVPGLALQASLYRFDSFASNETQPYTFGPGSILTWDGRLDNRDDMLLMLHRQLGKDVSDAAIVAAAYERWGRGALPRLIGDWSLALWDASSHTILLARDYAGNRPLFYRQTPAGISWATNLLALAAVGESPFEPEESYIAGKLTTGVPQDLTPYRGVRVMRPGQVLSATRAHGVSLERFWTLQPSIIRFKRREDYIDRLRELLSEAVRVRLRAKGTVWSHLSGGWDSSSIVCLAHPLIDRRLVEASAIRPLSLVSSASPESDESAFIGAVERWCGVPSLRWEFAGVPAFSDLLGHLYPLAHPPRFTLENMVPPSGDRIVLCGELGDLVMIKSSTQRISLLELLHEGHPLQFLSLCFKRAQAKQCSVWTILTELAKTAYMPKGRRRRSHQLRQRRERAKKLGIDINNRPAAFGVTPALWALVPDTPPYFVPPLEHFPIIKRPSVQILYSCIEHEILGGRVPGCWHTYPYGHRPLVEFMMATPQLVFWDAFVPREGMRRALADILPPEILNRHTKGDPTAVLTRANRERSSELVGGDPALGAVSDWELVRRGYLDEESAKRGLQELSGDRRLLFRREWLALEAWLRTLSARRIAPTPSKGPASVIATPDVKGFATASRPL